MCLQKVSAKSSYCTSEMFAVATRFTEKPAKEVDTSQLDTSEKLANLKQSDPFMYFSIPAVNNAVLHGKKSGPSDVQVSSARPSSPSEMETSQKVRRRSRVAFEGHPLLIMEDLFGAVSDTEVDDTEVDGPEIDILSLLERSVKKMRRA
jgi:hypothetical protein